MKHAARFLHAYLRGTSPATPAHEVTLDVAGDARPATVHRPAGNPGRRWVVLHGITATGRSHPSLLRFVHALAATGDEVIVPEVPAWRALSIDPTPTIPTVLAAIEEAERRDGPRPTGLVGFSFGATQAAAAAADPSLCERLDAVVAFGGYADLDRMTRFAFTGEHEWEGRSLHLEPDPYGRWVLCASYLEHVPGYESEGAVAGAVRRLAAEAGSRGVAADDPTLDSLRAELREDLPPGSDDLWRLLVENEAAASAEGRDLAAALGRTAARVHPALDPRPTLPGSRCPITLAHGVADRLVPYSEGLRLHRSIGREDVPPVALTRLLGHSRHEGRIGTARYLVEGARFFRLLHRALGSL